MDQSKFRLQQHVEAAAMKKMFYQSTQSDSARWYIKRVAREAELPIVIYGFNFATVDKLHVLDDVAVYEKW